MFNSCRCFYSFPLIVKLSCLVIVFPLGLNNRISVLLVLRLILFDLNQWTRSAKWWFINLFVCYRDLFLSNRLVSSAKWWTLLLLMDTFKLFMKIMNGSGPNTEPWGTSYINFSGLELLLLIFCTEYCLLRTIWTSH